MSMIEVNLKHLKHIDSKLGEFKKKTPNVLARAINRAAANVKTNMSKLTTQKYMIKNKAIKDTITIKKANKSNLGALVKSKTNNRIPLYKFKINPKTRPKKPPKSYKAQVRKSGSLKSILGAFVANINGINRLMQRKTAKNLPIKQLFGPSIPEMVGNKESIRKIQEEANETLKRRIDHEINRILEAGRK